MDYVNDNNPEILAQDLTRVQEYSGSGRDTLFSTSSVNLFRSCRDEPQMFQHHDFRATGHLSSERGRLQHDDSNNLVTFNRNKPNHKTPTTSPTPHKRKKKRKDSARQNRFPLTPYAMSEAVSRY
jgi:hypothetical protein